MGDLAALAVFLPEGGAPSRQLEAAAPFRYGVSRSWEQPYEAPMIFTCARVLAAAACLPVLALSAAMAHTALGPSNSGPPAPAPLGRSIGPPTDNVEDFLGVWNISWTGSVGTSCPCQGKLTIEAAGHGQLIGYWETRSGTYVLRGKAERWVTTKTPGPVPSENRTITPTFRSKVNFS